MKTYVVSTHQKCLAKALLMNTTTYVFVQKYIMWIFLLSGAMFYTLSSYIVTQISTKFAVCFPCAMLTE